MPRRKRWPRLASISAVLNSARPSPAIPPIRSRSPRTANLSCATCLRGRWLRWRSKTKVVKPILIPRRRSYVRAPSRLRGGAEEADRIAAAIADFSRPPTNAVRAGAFLAYAQDGRAYGPKAGSFETVLELDQVMGMRPELLQAVLPYVTVHSRTPGVDPRVAAPALLAALAGFEPARVTQLVGAARDRAGIDAPRCAVTVPLALDRSQFLVRAEVRTPAAACSHRRRSSK